MILWISFTYDQLRFTSSSKTYIIKFSPGASRTFCFGVGTVNLTYSYCWFVKQRGGCNTVYKRKYTAVQTNSVASLSRQFCSII
jgi:hypothetical protein